MRYLTTFEYDGLLLAGLTRYGIPEGAVRTLLEIRWPLFGPSVISEAYGRGVTLTRSDVQAFCDALVEKTGRAAPDAGTAAFMPAVFDEMLEWVTTHGRATPTLAGECMVEQPEQLRAMLEASRAGDN